MSDTRVAPSLRPRLAILGLAVVGFAVVSPSFRTVGSAFTILEIYAVWGLVALGLSITLIAGELDASVGPMAAVAGVIAMSLSETSLWLGVLVAIAVAGAIGFAQGWVIAKTDVNSIVLTIATFISLRGLALVLATERSVVLPLEHLGVSDFLRFRISFVSPFALLTIGAMVFVGIYLRTARSGREIYAIGGGREEAEAAGVSRTRAILIAFTLSATLAGVAGVLISAKSGAASPVAFENLLLVAATAALIADFGVAGGTGSVRGLAIGVLTIATISTGLASMGAPKFLESLVTGLLLLSVLAIELHASRRRPAIAAGSVEDLA